jgi:hypothetical protein
MKLFPLMLLAVILVLGGCTAAEHSSTNAISTVRTFSQVKLVTQSKYPTVGIREYTLITDDVEARRADAEAIMQVKIEIPRAMQTKDPAQFDRILARNFTFRGEEEFFNRDDYIKNRVTSPNRVKTADYQNIVLQFFGDYALLTYRNIVEDEPGGPTAWKAAITWADIFVKEDGQWKIGAVHGIDLKMLNETRTVVR